MRRPARRSSWHGRSTKQRQIIVGPDAVIRAYVIGSKDELKPGANINIVRATKKPDGTFEADRVNVGRDGVVP